MSKDGLIHIPGRRKQPTAEHTAVKLSPEAYNALVEIYNESTLSMKQIASLLIINAADRVVYDREER
jgi:ribonuclease HIII